MWEPLPLILYGYAVHPLTPSRRDTRFSTRTRDTEASVDDHFIYKDVVSLEVGDEIYAFERYTPRGKEVDSIWYRGYVVCTARRPPVTWPQAGDTNQTKTSSRIEEPQQVFIGIFPSSHIHIRDELSDAEGRLPLTSPTASRIEATTPVNGTTESIASSWNRERSPMYPVKEEDEIDKYSISTSRKSFRLAPPPDQAGVSRGGLPVYSASIRSPSPDDSGIMKPLPPRPSLKSGDDTASGQTQPIVDEIASALREWHSLMFHYLARRDYKLFHTVKEHIEALHLGRRQLLAQTLSAEETIKLRRECVLRLVSGNVVQGLDVIVRHPSWGGLATVNATGEIDPRSWTSAVRMYAMQASLGYLNATLDDRGSRTLIATADPSSTMSLPTPAHSVFADVGNVPKAHTRSAVSNTAASAKVSQSKFYHIFLDLRAFVASPCLPGETAELYFSLYRKSGTQFITEDFCAILNHNGVLAKDPTKRVRTIFTDLATADIQDSVYLVCKIVRHGSMKSGNGPSATPDMARRGSEASTRADIGASPTEISGSRGQHAADPSSYLRRPFGCAVLELSQLASMIADNADSSSTKEYTMPIYTPTNELSFSMIHQNIINSNAREYEKSPRADSLAVSIKVFRGDVSTTVKENPGLLQDTPRTLRLGFPDVVFPGDNRNELYVKLWVGDFAPHHSPGGRLSVTNFTRGPIGPQPNNVEVAVEVRDYDGSVIGSIISQGSGEDVTHQFRSLVFQRCNEPTYGELFKVQLPANIGVPNWHLFFTFRNRSSRDRPANKSDGNDKPFAFAFLPLFPDKRAFVEDGSHSLITYKADKILQLPSNIYLSCPAWLTPGQKPEQIAVHPDMQRLAPPLRDTLTIRTSLASTKFTHNSVLLSLLNWEQIADRDLLVTVLTKFIFIGEGEIVKFLRDIFDALFGILVSTNHEAGDLEQLVFNALVAVLSIIQDRRFINFQSVLDVYIEEHFSCASAASHIIHSMNHLLANPTKPENASPLRSALKVWHYIIKFITRARELQRAREAGVGGGATAEHLEATFQRELKAHINEVTKMMSSTSPASIGTQTIALQHFTTILSELAKVFTTLELVTFVTSFANHTGASGKGPIVTWKLVMYLQIVKGFLFDNSESRPLIVESVVLWLKPHFGRYDNYNHLLSSDIEHSRDSDSNRISWLESIRLCVSIVAVMLDKLQQYLVDPIISQDKRLYRQEQDNVEQLLTLIPRLLDSYRELQNPESLRVMERAKGTKLSIPVTFPESYPFSLLALIPDSQRSESSGPYAGTSVKASIPGLGETATVFLVIGLCSPNKHILDFLESSLGIEGRERFVGLLTQFFRVAVSILDNDAFPKSWLNMNILAHKVIVKMMEPILTLLEKEFIPDQDSGVQFDVSLWRDAFSMLLKLLSSDQLVIEEFSPQKRRAVWRLAGDLRGEGSAIMLQLWQALGWMEIPTMNGEVLVRYGGYQTQLYTLVGQIVHLCLSHHEQLRSNAVQMLYSMIISMYQDYANFDDIEHELVTRLDTLFMSDSRGEDILGNFFVTQLRHMFETSEVNEHLRQRVSTFLDSVEQFLELLRTVRALPDGDEFADERVIATLRLMNFIRVIGRDEIYIKYVHQLVNMHLQSQNYVEAALTLKLHADLHQWDMNAFVAPMEELGLPQQSQFHRKETLCLLILDYLGQGKAWENAMDICKELASQHAEVTYNYGRLSELLRHEATLLEHIVTEQRYYPDYYLITFYGNFPSAIRDKRFIYRGYEWEKFGAFCERMLNKHPGAQLLKTAGDPPVDIRFGNDQYIQCTAVTPEPDRTSSIFTNPDVPSAVRAYYEHSAISSFSSSRQIRKQARDGAEENWTERIYYTTEEKFPTVLRRSQVINMTTLDISPVEAALEEVEQKTKELSSLFSRYDALAKTSQQVSTNPLAMSLNSAVDTPVFSGIPFYKQTFFNPDYLARNPERANIVERLNLAIEAHVQVIDSCLRLHGTLCPAEFIPFHETLEKFFRKNFHDEIRRLGIEPPEDTVTISPSMRSGKVSRDTPAPSLSNYEPSLSQSVSRSSLSIRRPAVAIPALNFDRPRLSPPPPSPQSPTSPISPTSVTTPQPAQSLLQRHLAHLARHGINGVSSAPGDVGGSDSLSVSSPRNSFVNVGASQVLHTNGMHSAPTIHASGNSVMGYNVGSMGSLGSIGGTIRGRISRFGSLNFGKQKPSPS